MPDPVLCLVVLVSLQCAAHTVTKYTNLPGSLLAHVSFPVALAGHAACSAGPCPPWMCRHPPRVSMRSWRKSVVQLLSSLHPWRPGSPVVKAGLWCVWRPYLQYQWQRWLSKHNVNVAVTEEQSQPACAEHAVALVVLAILLAPALQTSDRLANTTSSPFIRPLPSTVPFASYAAAHTHQAGVAIAFITSGRAVFTPRRFFCARHLTQSITTPPQPPCHGISRISS